MNRLLHYQVALAEKDQIIEEQRHQISVQREQIAEVTERLHKLEGQRAKYSQNSSKPPSTDGVVRKTKSLREKSGKSVGGQRGPPGSTLLMGDTPDHIQVLHPKECQYCQTSLAFEPAKRYERRQVQDIPPIHIQVTEFRANEVPRPHCQQVTNAPFPREVAGHMQYGPQLTALVVYLMTYLLLPYQRTAELVWDVLGCAISPGTLETMVAQAAERLEGAETSIKEALRTSDVIGNDETGLYVKKHRQWMHVARSPLFTVYTRHLKRGKKATDAIGILPTFHGISVHDGYSSYPQYTQCWHDHSLRYWRYYSVFFRFKISWVQWVRSQCPCLWANLSNGTHHQTRSGRVTDSID